jgi:hypothetical protein
MKFFIIITLTILTAYIVGALFPWWMIFPFIAVIYALFSLKPRISFLCGFAALFLLWAILTLSIDISNHHLLSKKISLIFLQNEHYGYMILIAAFIGALIGGLSALTGSLAGSLYKQIKKAG